MWTDSGLVNRRVCTLTPQGQSFCTMDSSDVALWISSSGCSSVSFIASSKCVVSHFSCIWLLDPVDSSLPGSSVHGILQARILEWVSVPSSRGSSQPKGRTHASYVPCIGRQFLYRQYHLEALCISLYNKPINIKSVSLSSVNHSKLSNLRKGSREPPVCNHSCMSYLEIRYIWLLSESGAVCGTGPLTWGVFPNPG